ncbi:hypothetical protein BDN72DRAFT_905602 [Pluteus cervinus]|uniref:Uncharacterized protein n=1 Tax=Pluteus cervinus TaxID=181527 RepID=A0ACD3A235_9AGAR|nr:hypothetical protein BDN72DRAFT_905602 [Pluteus cervinus]
MTTVSHHVPAFYVPGALPPSLPLPIAQTELLSDVPETVIAHQELPLADRRIKSNHRKTPYTHRKEVRIAIPSPATTPPSRHRPRTTPSGSRTPPRPTSSRAPSRATSRVGESTPADNLRLSSVSSLSSLDDDEQDIIPRPDGESGRPGRGGYTLKRAVSRHLDNFEEINEFVRKLCDNELDTAYTITFQSPAAVQSIREKAARKFPELERFADLWPVNGIIRAKLQYSSQAIRKAGNRS